MIEALAGHLSEPLARLTDPNQRVFWGYLLGSLVIAAVVLGVAAWRQHGAAAPRRVLAALADPGVWLHRSARMDYRLILLNAVLRPLALAPWALTALSLAVWFVGGLERVLGPPPAAPLGPTAVAVVYTVVLFLAWDLSRYALHRAMHRIPLLWEFHKVHHSAEVLTPLTLYRTHPVESVLYSLRGTLVTGLVTGGFFYLFRSEAVQVSLLGVNVFGVAFNAVGANLRHSHVWVSYGPWLERLLISPAQHQIHHSADRAHWDRNFGTWLAVWDRLGGSLVLAGRRRRLRFGLDRDQHNHSPHRALSAVVGPVAAAARRVAGRAGGGLGGRRRPGSPDVVAATGPAVASAAPTEPGDAAAGGDSGAVFPTTLLVMALFAGLPVGSGALAQTGATTTGPAAKPATAAAAPAAATPPAPYILDPRDAATHGGAAPASATATTDGEASAGTTAPAAIIPGVDLSVDTVSILGDAERMPRVAGSAHKVAAEELERYEYDDVHRVLSGVPGVYVRGEDGYGLRPNIGLRGANSNRSSKITLMEDGVLMAPAPYAAPAAYYFPLITRMVGVEVFKGPAAVRFGPHTIGGAINLQTRAIPAEPVAHIDTSYGLYRTAKIHGYGGASGTHWGVLAEAARIQSGGFKELDGGGPTGFEKSEAMVKARVNSSPGAALYQQLELKLGFGDERSHETYLGLTDADFAANPYRRYAASRRDVMDWYRTQAVARYSLAAPGGVEVELVGYRHEFHRDWTKLDRFQDGPALSAVLAAPDAGQTAVFYAILTGEEDSASPDQNLIVQSNDRAFLSEGVEATAVWQSVWGPTAHTVRAGARLHHDAVERDHIGRAFRMERGVLVPTGSGPLPSTRNEAEALTGAFYVHEELVWRDLTVAPGLRAEVIDTEFADELGGTRQGNADAVWIPGLGVHYQATGWLGVLAGAHRGFSPVAPGQPAGVEPETSVNYEAGVRVGTERTRAELIGFLNDYDNLTAQCTFSSGCTGALLDRQFNGGAVRVYGLEAVVDQAVPMPAPLRLRTNLTYTLTQSEFQQSFLSANPQLGAVAAGDELPYVPEHQGAAAVVFGWAEFEAGANISYVGAMRDVAGQGAIPADQRVEEHVVVDLSARYTIGANVQLYAVAQNLLDNDYMVSRRPYGVRPGHPLMAEAGIKLTVAP